jgi:hypothetical protein
VNSEQQKILIESIRANEAEKLAELINEGHPNPCVRVWGMLPGRDYGATLKSTRSMKVLGYQVGVEKRCMPVAVAKRLVKAGHCTWGLLDGQSADPTNPGLWIRIKTCDQTLFALDHRSASNL